MTTETPNPDKKPAPPRPVPAGPTMDAATIARAADRKVAISGLVETIPVALVRFDRAIQYPGKGQSNDDSAKTVTMANGNSWTVDYLPALRHFRITHEDKVKGTKVGYVPVERALSWEPLA